MYQNASEMWSNKYMYMPFNITSHTNIQFDLEKQSHSMLSMHYRSLYRLCLFSHWEVHKPVTTLTLYVCMCFEGSLLQHWFSEVNSVFRSSFWQLNTFWTSKNTTRNKNLSVRVGRNPFFCSHLLCLIWRFSCTITSHKDWHTHHIMTWTSIRGYVHEFNYWHFLQPHFRMTARLWMYEYPSWQYSLTFRDLIFLGLQQSFPHDPSHRRNLILVRDVHFVTGWVYLLRKTFCLHVGTAKQR